MRCAQGQLKVSVQCAARIAGLSESCLAFWYLVHAIQACTYYSTHSSLISEPSGVVVQNRQYKPVHVNLKKPILLSRVQIGVASQVLHCKAAWPSSRAVGLCFPSSFVFVTRQNTNTSNTGFVTRPIKNTQNTHTSNKGNQSTSNQALVLSKHNTNLNPTHTMNATHTDTLKSQAGESRWKERFQI